MPRRKILKTTIGGKDFGGSKLTDLATRFITLYKAYEAEVTNFAQEKSVFIKDWRIDNEK